MPMCEKVHFIHRPYLDLAYFGGHARYIVQPLSPSRPVFADDNIFVGEPSWISLLSWRYFFSFFLFFVLCTSMLSLSIFSSTVSTAQCSTAQSPLRKAANQVRADHSTYQKKYERTCMRRPGCFPEAWSSWHLHVPVCT